MSWLGRSIANTLLIEDDHPHPTTTSSSSIPILKGRQQIEDQDRTGGVKEDLSEFTESLKRQLRGVASFLAPPPPLTHPYHTNTFDPDLYVSGEDDDHPSNSAYDDPRFGDGNGISDSLSFPTGDKIQSIEAVGVTAEALAFARNISHHPETWLDFPLSEEEDDDDFEMSDTQWNHVTLVERLAPRLAALRIELCPIHMSESYFWKVYFVLLHPRLNIHEADLLSTPQIVAARTMWMKELQKRTKPEPGLSETATCDGSTSVHEDFSIASDLPCAANTLQRTTHALEHTSHDTTTGSHKAVTQEEVQTSWTSLDHRTACSYTIPIEDEEDDDWIHENSEQDGYVGPDVCIGTDEDISFSDLEADGDCTIPVRSSIV